MSSTVKEKLASLAIDRTAPVARKRPSWLLAAAAGVAVVVLAVTQIEAPHAAQAVVPAASTAALATPGSADTARTPMSNGAIASGYVVAHRSATISADVAGRLVSVKFEEGSSVQKGQLLAELDSGLARYDLELAQARLQSARAAVDAVKVDLAEGQSQLSRAQQLSKTSTISPAALESVKTRMQAIAAREEAAKADVRVAQAAVDRQAALLEQHKVVAPFAGVITAQNAESGEVLSTSDVSIATLVDMTSLEVEVDVNEGQISQIAAKQKASIVLESYPDHPIPGVVLAVIPTADRERATIRVRVGFSQLDSKILPHMAAKVTFARMEK